MPGRPNLPNKLMNQPREMFFKCYHHFRRIMCSTKYSLEKKDAAFEALCQDYIRCNLIEADMILFVAMQKEWVMRRGYEEESGGGQ